MGIRKIALALICVAGFATQATAQEQAGASTLSRVVVINTDDIYLGTLMGKRISADLEARARELQAENEQITAALTAEEKSLTERRATMDPAAFRKEAAEFDTRVQGIRRARDSAIATFEAERDGAPRAFLEQVRNLIGDVMIERGAAVVLDQRIVFLSLSSVDITRDVIARIDEAMGDGIPDPEADK